MRAWNIGTDDKRDHTVQEPEAEFGGFRARWKKRSFAMGSEVDSEEPQLETFSEMGGIEKSGKQLKAVDNSKALQFEDKAVDSLLDDLPSYPSGSSGLSDHQQVQAISNTNMQVFKFPWEKGRLAKIFSDKPLVQLKTPQLQLGPRSFVRMGIEVTDDGSVRAKPAINAEPKKAVGAVFLDVVKSLQDAPVLVDREARRTQALHAWWELLSHSLVSSAVGLKVSVEATMDTVLEVAIQILDATFAVKSLGTLFRRLYAIQAFEGWMVEKMQRHWLPVSEYDVWSFVRWLKASNAPPTKASSLVEALRFSWFLLGVGAPTWQRRA
eukprot:s2135_g13.t1